MYALRDQVADVDPPRHVVKAPPMTPSTMSDSHCASSMIPSKRRPTIPPRAPANSRMAANGWRRAVSCVLDNAMRAAGTDGHVTVEVSGTNSEITIGVIDDGPGLGHVPTNNGLGLTITRALVSACGGGFELTPGLASGVVAKIVLPTVRYPAVP